MDGHSPIPNLILRQYQLDGIEAVREQIRAGKRRIVFVLATGGGKTATAGSIVRGAVALGKRVLFVAHRRELINQTYATLQRLGLSPDLLGVIMAGDRRHRPTAPVQIASIDTLRGRLHWPDADLVIVDEAHRSLSKSYLDLIARYSSAVVLGLTATPYRGDNRGLGEAYESLVVIATPRLLMDEGYLVEPIVFTVERLPDVSGVRTTAGDYNDAQLAEAVDRTELVGNIVEHWITHARGMRTVVFAVNVAHSRHITGRFVAAGVAAEHLDGTMRAADRDAILARLERGETRVVSSCGVLSEGWDQPSVKCAVLARPTKSTGLYLQCLDAATEVLTARGFLGVDEIRDDDVVAALDRTTSEVSWQPIVSRTDRALADDEAMFELLGPGVDLRVTGGHRMLYASRTTGAKWGIHWPGAWSVCTAAELSMRKSGMRIPCAGEQRAPGVPLTDDELRFIGWFVTDGTLHRTNGAISISQANHQPQIHDLRRCIEGCGFKYAAYQILPKGMANASPQTRFTVSRGSPRGRDKHLTGWGRLAPYIDKDLSPELERMDARQFAVLLEAIHLGDGHKQRYAAAEGWTPDSYHIVSVRKRFVDRLQSLCVRRGWRCNVSAYDPDPAVGLARRRLYSLHIKRQPFRSIGGAGHADKARMLPSIPIPGERVWCVENQLGTIFVRRGGKVAVVGNCAGRILRPYQDLPAIILDHAGNAIEHGLPQDDREFALHMPKRRAKAASVRTCQQCFAVLSAATKQCPHCGYEFAAAPAEPVDLSERDGKLVEITAPKNADEAERHAMRRKIQSLAVHHDRSHGLAIGETNRRLQMKFGKSRSDMTLLELYAVWQYFESGAYAIDHAPRIDAPPPFLSAAQEVVTWPL